MKFNLTILIISRFMQVVFSLLTVKIMSSIYNKSEIGDYYLILSYSSLFVLFFHSPVSSYISRFFYVFEKKGFICNVLLKYFKYSVFIQLLCVPILFICYYCFDYSSKISVYIFIFIVSISALSQSVFNRFVYSVNMIGKVKFFSFSLIFSSFFSLVLSYALTFKYNSPIVWVLGSSLVFLIISFLSFFFLKKENVVESNEVFNFKEYGALYNFAYPIAISSFFMWGLNIGYRVIIDNKFSSEMLGQIAIGFGIPIAIFSAVSTIISQYFYPKFYYEVNNGNGYIAWQKLVGYVFPIYLITLFYIIGLSKHLLVVLAGEAFHDIYVYVIFGSILEFLKYAASTYSMMAHVKCNTKKIMLPYFLGCLFLIVGLVLTSSESIFAVSSLIFLSYFIVFVLIYFNVKAPKIKLYTKDFYILLVIFVFLYPFFYMSEYNSLHQSFFCVLIFGLFYVLFLYFVFKKRH